MRLSRNPSRLPAARWGGSVYLYAWALLTVLATFILVIAGGLVTSKGVGMAVPDWPNSYGYNMFFFPPSKWVGGVFYEHTHRLIASAVGLCTSVLAVWLFGKAARPFLRWTGLLFIVGGAVTWLLMPARWTDAFVLLITGFAALGSSFVWPNNDGAPKWLRRLGVAAFFAVVLQGLLGGLRVVLYKDQIGIFHALLAQIFLGLVCSIAVFTSGWWKTLLDSTPATSAGAKFRLTANGLFVVATFLILLQLGLGASMRHQHAGLAIPDFPLAYGKIWPSTDPTSVALYNQQRLEVMAANPITATQIWLQMAHRFLAVGILATVAACAWRARRSSNTALRNLSITWLILILLQVLLGAATVWSNKAADIATGHVLVGAMSLVTGIVVSLISAGFKESDRIATQAVTQPAGRVTQPKSSPLPA